MVSNTKMDIKHEQVKTLIGLVILATILWTFVWGTGKLFLLW